MAVRRGFGRAALTARLWGHRAGSPCRGGADFGQHGMAGAGMASGVWPHLGGYRQSRPGGELWHAVAAQLCDFFLFFLHRVARMSGAARASGGAVAASGRAVVRLQAGDSACGARSCGGRRLSGHVGSARGGVAVRRTGGSVDVWGRVIIFSSFCCSSKK